jgi:hypothetical protein
VKGKLKCGFARKSWMTNFSAVLFLSLLLAGAAQAQPACSAPPAAGGTNVALTSAAASPELEPARLALDQAATVTLHPVGEVRFVTAPEKRGNASSFGGMLAVDVREAGTYQVGLSTGAWIDVLKDGAAVASTAHDHGAECSGLRKMVSFALTPGRHVIQLSGNRDETIRVTVSRKQ